MARILQLRVVTPERSVYQGDADFVVVPAHDGEIGILPRHARLLAALGAGELRATSGGNVQRFFVEGGVVQVRDDRVTVLCDRARRLEEMDLAQLEAEAQAAHDAHTPDAARLAAAASALRRALGSQAGSPTAKH
jgi:F-type H+-transporting ATPase subunit epsilon